MIVENTPPFEIYYAAVRYSPKESLKNVQSRVKANFRVCSKSKEFEILNRFLEFSKPGKTTSLNQVFLVEQGFCLVAVVVFVVF
jgi:hypothetical protein